MTKKQPVAVTDPELINLGINVAFYRNQLGWSQERLDAETGIDKGDISRIESGFVDVGYKRLLRLSKALRVTLDQLASSSR